MERREFLQMLKLAVANGTLVRMGASATTMSLAGSLAAHAEDPPANPMPPPTASADSGYAGPAPSGAPTPDPTNAESYGFGDYQKAASDAVTAVTDAINADTHSVSSMPASGSPLDLDSLGGITTSLSATGHADTYGDTTSKGYGVAAYFNPLTLNYGGEVFTVDGTGKATTPVPSASVSFDANLGSGNLGGFNGPSDSTSASFGKFSGSASTNPTFASVGLGLSYSTSPVPGISTERTYTTVIEIQVHGNTYKLEGKGNAGDDAARVVKSVGDSVNALLHVGDTVMSLVP